MPNNIKDRPNTIPWPPIIFLGVAVIAVLLNRLWPIAVVPEALQSWFVFAGAAVAGLGLALDLGAMSAMRRARTNILPHRAADQLVTDGVFAFSRNPIYLGNTMLLIGIGLVLGSVWMIGGAFVAALLCDRLAIRREEHHLRARFGEAFAAYARRVPRWIGPGGGP